MSNKESGGDDMSVPSREASEDRGFSLQSELARPHSRRGVVLALTAGGLVLGTGLAGTIWWFLTHRAGTGAATPGIGIPSATPAKTIIATSTETSVSPDDLAFEQQFLNNDPAVRQQLLQT